MGKGDQSIEDLHERNKRSVIHLIELSPLTAYRIGWVDDIPELEQFPNFRNPGDIPGLWLPHWEDPRPDED